jgi:hypothetical protein
MNRFSKCIFIFCILLSIFIVVSSFKSQTENHEVTRLTIDYDDELELNGRVAKLVETDSYSLTKNSYEFDTSGQTTYSLSLKNHDTISQYWYSYANGRMAGWIKRRSVGMSNGHDTIVNDSVVCLYDVKGNKTANIYLYKGGVKSPRTEKFYYDKNNLLIRSVHNIPDMENESDRYFYGADKKRKRSVEIFDDAWAAPFTDKKTFDKNENCILDSSFDGKKLYAVTKFAYDSLGNTILDFSRGSDFKDKRTYVYEYDANGNWIKQSVYFNDTLKRVYKREYDEKGNWIKEDTYEDDKLTSTLTREITYYPE